MSETGLLLLVATYPNATALARRARDGSTFAAVRRLEARGYIRRSRGDYSLTHRGWNELVMTVALLRLAA